MYLNNMCTSSQTHTHTHIQKILARLYIAVSIQLPPVRINGTLTYTHENSECWSVKFPTVPMMAVFRSTAWT